MRQVYAMMKIVEAAYQSYSKKKRLDIVDKEIHQELIFAHNIVELMRNHWRLTWEDISLYVTSLPKSWDDLGTAVNLEFLGQSKTIK